MKVANQVKTEIQQQAHTAWLQTGRMGSIAAGTGVGKSRIAIMEVERMHNLGFLKNKDDVLLVTPTVKLRDENWPMEFRVWGQMELFNKYVKPICFASLKNEKDNHYKLVIIDELHHVTDLSAQAFTSDDEDQLSQFFAENLADAVMGLTATEPDSKREPEKTRIVAQIAPVVFRYTLDQGVSDGMIADYEIRVILMPLDSTNKYIQAGTKVKPFKTTEAKQYEYLEKQIKRYRMLANQTKIPAEEVKFEKLALFATFNRNRFLYNLASKTTLAERCLKHMLGQKRTLVFCGSIAQCDKLLAPNVYHSRSSSDAFEAFNNKEVGVLGVVQAANEGINFNDLDQVLILQMDSNSRNLVQRVGRCLRPREGHKAAIYIICVEGTADEKWLDKSLTAFDPSKVTYYSSKSIPA